MLQQVEREGAEQRDTCHLRRVTYEDPAESETVLEVRVGKLAKARSSPHRALRLGRLHASKPVGDDLVMRLATVTRALWYWHEQLDASRSHSPNVVVPRVVRVGEQLRRQPASSIGVRLFMSLPTFVTRTPTIVLGPPIGEPATASCTL